MRRYPGSMRPIPCRSLGSVTLEAETASRIEPACLTARVAVSHVASKAFSRSVEIGEFGLMGLQRTYNL